jgi:arylsulfatase A-like enzyme
MSDTESSNSNPIATAAIVGLGWGLVFGLVDGLPVLLEDGPLDAAARRLLSLAYVTLFNALLFGLALTFVGLATWVLLRLARRSLRQAQLLGLYTGICTALSVAAYALHRYQPTSPVIVGGLALAAGCAMGWLVRSAAARSALSSRTTRMLAKGVLGMLCLCILVLGGVALFRVTIRDLPALNPRVTGEVASPERPNIVLISIDALRADRLGVYGNDPEVSPRIDALASRGVRFDQAITQGSSTVPSVSSFMTSLHPSELGIISGRVWYVDEAFATLAEALQVAGYRTQAYVTNPHLVPAKGHAQGFDNYVAPEPDRPYGLDRLRTDPILPGLLSQHLETGCPLFDAGYDLLFDRLLVVENEGGRVNSLARRFLRLQRDEQFFLWLHYMEPHAAYTPSQPFRELPPSVTAEREAFLRAWQPSKKTWPLVFRSDDVAALKSLYDGEILDVDRWIGAIWDEIETQGLADRTLLVITADHGDEFGEHGGFGHSHTVYQELDRVPLIVVGPQVQQPGRVIDMPVPLLDILPTLLDVAGAPFPSPIRGDSLLPVLQGGEPTLKPIVSESPARRSTYDDKALRLGDYKAVHNVNLDRTELYDLSLDPQEQHDLSPIEPERALAMRDQLREWAAAALQTWASLPQAGARDDHSDAALEEALRRIGY